MSFTYIKPTFSRLSLLLSLTISSFLYVSLFLFSLSSSLSHYLFLSLCFTLSFFSLFHTHSFSLPSHNNLKVCFCLCLSLNRLVQLYVHAFRIFCLSILSILSFCPYVDFLFKSFNQKTKSTRKKILGCAYIHSMILPELQKPELYLHFCIFVCLSVSVPKL